jgi:nicotinamide phosphoribosyltransferase
LDNIVPVVAKKYAGKFGLWVLRPDSGNPVECVIQGLKAAEKAFGVTPNKKGYKVLNGAAVIQGDGITITEIGKILEAVQKEGFSVENVAFGMGAGLLQKLNRDTLSMATKLSHIIYNTGATLDIMKRPSDDKGKYSLPGEMEVFYEAGVPKVYPKETQVGGDNLLKVVYDKAPVDIKWDSFDTLKTYVNNQMLVAPAHADAISTQMYHKIAGLVSKKGL